MLLFWVFVDAMPGIGSKKDRAIGYIISGFLFGFIIMILPGVLKFFKFPVNFLGRFLIGTLLTLVMLLLLNSLFKGILIFGPGYVGGADMIIFTIPKLLKFPNALSIILFSSVFTNLCSIMLTKMPEG